MEQVSNPGLKQKETEAFQKNYSKQQEYVREIEQLKKVREAQGLKSNELQAQVDSEIAAIKEENKLLLENAKIAEKAKKNKAKTEAKNAESQESYSQELEIKKKILALEQEIELARVSKGKDANEAEAKNRPKINALEEELDAVNRIRKARSLYSTELRQQVDSELTSIERENNAILEGKEVASRLKIGEGLGDYVKDLSKLTDIDKYTKPFIDEVNACIESLKKLQTDANSLDFDELKNEFQKAGESVDKLFDESKLQDSKKALEKNLSALEAKIEKYVNKNSAMGLKFRGEVDQIRTALEKADSQADLSNVVVQFNKLEASVNRAKKTGLSFFDMFTKRVKSMSATALARYFSFYDIISYTKQAVTTIKELDTALVDLRKTTTMTASELNDFYYDANEVAKQLGVTTEEIINQAAAWSRLNKIGLLYGNV